MNAAKQKIIDTLTPMFRQAEADKLWFHSLYGDIWMTPEELKAAQDEGRLCWGAENWELRNPVERLCRLHDQMEQSKKMFHDFGVKLRNLGYIDKSGDVVQDIENAVEELIV